MDLFLHHVWDPFMLDELGGLKRKDKALLVNLPHSTGDRGTRLAQAPPLHRKKNQTRLNVDSVLM